MVEVDLGEDGNLPLVFQWLNLKTSKPLPPTTPPFSTFLFNNVLGRFLSTSGVVKKAPPVSTPIYIHPEELADFYKETHTLPSGVTWAHIVSIKPSALLLLQQMRLADILRLWDIDDGALHEAGISQQQMYTTWPSERKDWSTRLLQL